MRIATPHARVLLYPNQRALAYAFARFQEFHENPVLAGKYFSRAELEAWWQTQKPGTSYYESWNGFNMPMAVFRKAVDAFGIDMDHDEFGIYAEVRADPQQYLIGVHAQHADLSGVLMHELAHSMYLSEPYLTAALGLMTENYASLEPVRQKLLKMGYGPQVIPDEIQAYAVAGAQKLELSTRGVGGQAGYAMEFIGLRLRPFVEPWHALVMKQLQEVIR